MRIMVNIPDEFAAQVQAQGLSSETYVERLIAETAQQKTFPLATKPSESDEFYAIPNALGNHSDKVPSFSIDAFSRESLYNDHD